MDASAAASAGWTMAAASAVICLMVDDASGHGFAHELVALAAHTGTARIEIVGSADGHAAFLAGDHAFGDSAAAGERPDKADEDADQTHTGALV